MLTMVNIHAAKTHLSRLVDRAAGGEEIVIARAGKPVARLAPLRETSKPRKPGLMRGRIVVAKDFDAPLPKELLDAFYTGSVQPRRRRR
jgi:prevent-host-death family protein